MVFIEDVAYELGRRTIERMYPEYVVLTRVEGGWALFKSYDEYRTWKAQK